MRELSEQDTGDGAETGTGSSPDVAAGHGGDSLRPAIATVRDAATRTALELEYRWRVEAEYAASGIAVAASPDERGACAHDASGKGDHVSGQPSGRDTGDRGDNHRGVDARPQDTAWRPIRHRRSSAHRDLGAASPRQGDRAVTAAREYDAVRTTIDIVSDDGRTIPAGMRGAVLDAKPDGTCLAEFAFTPQTADIDGDFVQGVLTEGQYEIIRA